MGASVQSHPAHQSLDYRPPVPETIVSAPSYNLEHTQGLDNLDTQQRTHHCCSVSSHGAGQDRMLPSFNEECGEA